MRRGNQRVADSGRERRGRLRRRLGALRGAGRRRRAGQRAVLEIAPRPIACTLLPPATCDALVAELEVELAAGRSDARYPLAGYTREARVADMAAGRTLLSDALVDRILPAAADRLGFRADRLRVNEALVVKYDAASGHNALPVHADFSLLTVNVGLSDSGEYGGGGTWFQHDGAVINCEQGHALVHALASSTPASPSPAARATSSSSSSSAPSTRCSRAACRRWAPPPARSRCSAARRASRATSRSRSRCSSAR